MEVFLNREEAGRALADWLQPYKAASNTIVLALPRGGVPVAREVATALHLPFDILLVRKLGCPGQEEVAMGALAYPDIQVLNRDILLAGGVTQAELDRAIVKEGKELQRRNLLYRGGRQMPELAERIVILIDDGMATGATMHAAVQAVRQQKPARIIIAVPLASREAIAELSPLVDRIVCPYAPDHFMGVGAAYHDFGQLTDAEIKRILP